LNTAKKDNPTLLSKIQGAKQPIRLVIDASLEMPLRANIFQNCEKFPVIVATTKSAPHSRQQRFREKGAELLFVRTIRGRIDLKDLLKKLGMLNIMHLLVEGGGELIASLVEARLVDRFLFFIAPKIIGGRSAITSVEGSGISRMSDAVMLKELKVKKFANDVLIESEVS